MATATLTIQMTSPSSCLQKIGRGQSTGINAISVRNGSCRIAKLIISPSHWCSIIDYIVPSLLASEWHISIWQPITYHRGGTYRVSSSFSMTLPASCGLGKLRSSVSPQSVNSLEHSQGFTLKDPLSIHPHYLLPIARREKPICRPLSVVNTHQRLTMYY